jgi:hypothetical protein
VFCLGFVATTDNALSIFVAAGDFGGGGGGQHQDYVSVPTSKCGLIIGKGGETIKSINQVRNSS